MITSTQISPRLGRFNIVSNSFASCISNAPKEFSWTPEVSFGEIISQPRMFAQKLEGTITFEQLQSSADAHCWRHLNKQMDVVNSNMQFINFESMPVSCLPDEKFTIHSDSIKLHGVSSILALPNKVEGILPECMFSTCQIHFFAPDSAENFTAHAKSFSLVHGDRNNPPDINRNQELNLLEGRIPPVLESTGILRQM